MTHGVHVHNCCVKYYTLIHVCYHCVIWLRIYSGHTCPLSLRYMITHIFWTLLAHDARALTLQSIRGRRMAAVQLQACSLHGLVRACDIITHGIHVRIILFTCRHVLECCVILWRMVYMSITAALNTTHWYMSVIIALYYYAYILDIHVRYHCVIWLRIYSEHY